MTPEPLSSAEDRDRPAIDAAMVDAMALAVYGGFLALACRSLRIDVAAVRALAPRKGATADAEWFTAAKARHVAIYLTNQAVGIPQRTLARLLDLTPPAIHFAIRSVEDLRDDTTFDRLVSAIERGDDREGDMSRSKQTTRSDLRRAECRDRAAEIGAFVARISDAELASRFRQWIEGRLIAAETMAEPFGIVRISEKFLAEVAEVLRPFWPDLAARAIGREPPADCVVFASFGRSRPGEWRDVPTKDVEVIALGSHRPDTPDT